MKVVAISDLHGNLPEMPDGDLLCISGDISPLRYQRNFAEMGDWLLNEFLPWAQRFKGNVVFCAGNHDFIFDERINDIFRQTFENRYLDKFDTFMAEVTSPDSKVRYLFDNEVSVNGKRIYGTPWVEGLHGWAFSLPDFSLKKRDIFNKIPEGIDILLTHEPPAINSLNKVLQEDDFNFGAEFGSDTLLQVIKERKPKYVLSGHVHSGNHELTCIDGTYYANVSYLNERYQNSYEPLIFTP